MPHTEQKPPKFAQVTFSDGQAGYTAHIVGVTQAGRQEVVAALVPQTYVWLVREPGNPADNSAVLVLDAYHRVAGYLPRELAAPVAPALDARGGCWTARVDEVVGGEGGQWYGARISFVL